MLPTPSRGQHGTAQCASSKLRRGTLRWNMRAGASRCRLVVAPCGSKFTHKTYCPVRSLWTTFGLKYIPRRRWEAGSAFPRKVQFTGQESCRQTFNAWSSRKPQPQNFWYIPARLMGSPYEMARASNRLDNTHQDSLVAEGCPSFGTGLVAHPDPAVNPSPLIDHPVVYAHELSVNGASWNQVN